MALNVGIGAEVQRLISDCGDWWDYFVDLINAADTASALSDCAWTG